MTRKEQVNCLRIAVLTIILQDNEWIEIPVNSFVSIHNSFYDTLDFLRAQYNEYLESKRIEEKIINLKHW